ncbi:MAG TPA: toll/interleukin-1 receptor domain-containing protein [Anaerolineales bacterium]|nr:toll/interleukin-1 receptor domain-containing protein [Anaerolineales bacterium]
MGHLFISYSHQDKDYVYRLAEVLQANGFEVWIDDRIDYGTRWPLVIEDAIDHCESLILVASEHSRQSEWVQHEIARAQRLRKPIFPLLLSGHPWLAFEATQYYDVREGNLPAQKFYDALRLLEAKRFEYYREIIGNSWPVYLNAECGFSLRYPKNGKLSQRTLGFVQIEFPIVPGTNLAERSLAVYFQPNEDVPSPVRRELPWIYQRSYVDILGLRFLKESGYESGMSHYHEMVRYTTSRQSKEVTPSFHLTTSAAEVFGIGVVMEIVRTAAKEILSYVVSTFTWLD